MIVFILIIESINSKSNGRRDAVCETLVVSRSCDGLPCCQCCITCLPTGAESAILDRCVTGDVQSAERHIGEYAVVSVCVYFHLNIFIRLSEYVPADIFCFANCITTAGFEIHNDVCSCVSCCALTLWLFAAVGVTVFALCCCLARSAHALHRQQEADDGRVQGVRPHSH